MLLWRIGSNALPTKENLKQILEHIDSTCVLCKSESESCVHLFCECPITRAIWLAACWGFKVNLDCIASSEDIRRFIVVPPTSSLPSHDQWLFSLNMALTVDEIWRLRNHIIFQEGNIDILKSIQNVKSRFTEYSNLLSMDNVLTPEPSLPVWSPPPLGWMKINVDAALSSSKSALAAVARDHQGHVIKVWGSNHYHCSPIQAESAALLLAVELAIQEQWRLVIFEGDAEGCFDTLASADLLPDWSICTVINNIRSLVASLPFFKFCWAQRSCNSAAHAAAKFALSFCQSFCFNNGNLPLYIKSVCKVDCQACSFVSV